MRANSFNTLLTRAALACRPVRAPGRGAWCSANEVDHATEFVNLSGVVLGFALVSTTANAQENANPVTANVGVFSQYVFRGLTQTDRHPAVQGGFKKTWVQGISTDVGYLRYQYPGSYPALPLGTVKPNTDEAYAAIGWKWVSFKYSYAFSDLFGVENSDGS